jgi:phospholipase/carboxylesterase
MRRGGAPAHRAGAGLVMLHGRGGTAADMLAFAESLGLPDLAVIAPEAPGRMWWPVSFLASTADLAPWLERALASVSGAVEALVEEGLTRPAISIFGFSQGACLALEFAARHGRGLGPVFGLSGALIGTGDAPGDPRTELFGHRPKRFDYVTRLDGLTIDMSCHARDPHIPLVRFEESANVLRRLGGVVTHRIYEGAAHVLTWDDVASLRRHLNGPLPQAGAGPGHADSLT